MPVTLTEVRFRSHDAECAGVLIEPEGAGGSAPCVVLGHGFGALKEAGLIRSGERFAAAGYVALAFDYRHFGESGGEPRQLLDVGRQHADWRAAVSFARSLAGVDPDRIALWGSSFSGGHVIEIAAGDPLIAAVVSQVPHISGPATLRAAGAADAFRLTVAGVRDQAGALLGREPFTIPIVDVPGTTAAMNSPDAKPGYFAMYDDGFEWRNEVAGRFALTVGLYRPGRKIAAVGCPILVQVALDDVVTPPEPAIEAAARAPDGELITYAGLGHFDCYRGEHFERFAGDQLDFLGRRLPV
jgi:fermentation-respiration switch protein FrsA (DUF1100 family)